MILTEINMVENERTEIRKKEDIGLNSMSHALLVVLFNIIFILNIKIENQYV